MNYRTTITRTRNRRFPFGMALGFAISMYFVADADPIKTGRVLTDFENGNYGPALEACKEGNIDKTPDILYYIGYCIDYGLGGVEKDTERAKKFYHQAADAGNEKAKRRLEEISRIEDKDKELVLVKRKLDEISFERDEANRQLDEFEKRKKLEESEFNKRLGEWQSNRDKEIGEYEKEIAALKVKLEEAKKSGDDAVVGNIRKSLSEAEVRHSRALKDMERELGEMKRELNDMEGKYNVRFENLHNAIAGMHVEEKREAEMGMPLGFAMFAPGQFPPVEADVTGFRLSVFYGRNRNVFGLDVGALVSVADGDLMGLEVSGLFNQIGSSSGALQIGGIANVCADNFLGFQIAGIANRVEGDCAGLQVGTLNLASKDMVGVQIGAFNNAKNAKGLQIGVVNHAVKMTGVQIGLINLIDESSVSCLPIVNAHF